MAASVGNARRRLRLREGGTIGCDVSVALARSRSGQPLYFIVQITSSEQVCTSRSIA